MKSKTVDYIFLVLLLSFCYFAFNMAHVLHDVSSDCVVYKAWTVKECGE